MAKDISIGAKMIMPYLSLADLLKSFDARLMRVYPVNSNVNNVKNEGPECAEEVSISEGSPAQPKLF